MAGSRLGCLIRPDLQYVATMKKGESAVDTLRAAVAELWRKGAAIAWPVPPAPAPGAAPERAQPHLLPPHAASRHPEVLILSRSGSTHPVIDCMRVVWSLETTACVRRLYNLEAEQFASCQPCVLNRMRGVRSTWWMR